jgi:hypothetical protein
MQIQIFNKIQNGFYKTSKMKKILILIVMSVLLVSCDNTENVIFDGTKTLVYFEETSATLDVVIDDTGVTTAIITQTTLSDTDRAVTVGLVESQTTADLSNFTFNEQVVIPAGSYTGELIINGTDVSVETSPEIAVFEITDASGAAFERSLELSIKQICPIPEGTFLGDYQLTQVSPINPANGVNSFPNGVVTLVEDGASTRRAFEATYLGDLGIGQAAAVVGFDFVCNSVIVDAGIDTSLICDGETNIDLGPALNPSSYDPEDDSEFEITIREYATDDGGCGVVAFDTTFTLTKIN